MENHSDPLRASENRQNTHNPIEPAGAPKTILYAFVILALIAATIGTVIYVKNSHRIVENANLDLPEDGRMALEAQVKSLEEQAQALQADAPKEERFEVHYKLAEARYLLGRYREALTTLDQVAGENQDSARMHSLYASIYRDMKDDGRALESAKRALDLDPSSPQAWVFYIDLLKDKSAEEIKALYEEALDKTSGNVGIITAHAQFLEKIGDREGAISQWWKAREVFPQGAADYDAEIARLRQAQ